MVDAGEWDDREWMRDELLHQADQWADDLLLLAELRQKEELRRQLSEIVKLASMVTLTKAQRRKVDNAIAVLRHELAKGEA